MKVMDMSRQLMAVHVIIVQPHLLLSHNADKAKTSAVRMQFDESLDVRSLE